MQSKLDIVNFLEHEVQIISDPVFEPEEPALPPLWSLVVKIMNPTIYAREILESKARLVSVVEVNTHWMSDLS